MAELNSGPSPMQKFIASIGAGGVQHSNKFEIRLAPPGMKSEEEIVLRCESVTMPGRTLNAMTDANIFGPTREIVDGATFAEDVTCTFIADTRFKIRQFFEVWQERAFNPYTWEVRYHEEYKGKVEIYTLNRDGERQYGVTLHEAYPKNLGAQELNMASANELQKISVSFSYRNWTSMWFIG